MQRLLHNLQACASSIQHSRGQKVLVLDGGSDAKTALLGVHALTLLTQACALPKLVGEYSRASRVQNRADIAQLPLLSTAMWSFAGPCLACTSVLICICFGMIGVHVSDAGVIEQVTICKAGEFSCPVQCGVLFTADCNISQWAQQPKEQSLEILHAFQVWSSSRLPKTTL